MTDGHEAMTRKIREELYGVFGFDIIDVEDVFGDLVSSLGAHIEDIGV